MKTLKTHKAKTRRELDEIEIERENRRAANSRLIGPSQFELAYFRQLREEINIFLHSKGFTTIKEVHIDLFGPHFRGHLQVSA